MGSVQVNGGSEAVRFFSSAQIDNETGPIQMPQFEVDRFNSLHTPVRDEWFHPLAQQARVVPHEHLGVVEPEVRSERQRRLGRRRTIASSRRAICSSRSTTSACRTTASRGRALDKETTDVDGTPLNDYLQYAPGDIMQFLSQQDVQRFTGSANATWRPLSWLQNDGTIGIDHANLNFFSLCRVEECPPQSSDARRGFVEDDRRNNRNFSAKITSTATWNARQWMNLKTTVGADYTNSEIDSVGSNGSILPPGATTVAAATNFQSSELQPTATKTLGLYAQEQASFRDRLFVTVAARTDQNSAFGTDFQRVVYPKIAGSWIISDESFFPKYSWLNSFRLRSSFGASGVQPGRTSGARALPAERRRRRRTTVDAGSDDTPGLIASNPGNAELKPERSTEIEAGFETQVLNNRLHFDYTYYNKKTKDALINVPIAGSAGAPVTPAACRTSARRATPDTKSS